MLIKRSALQAVLPATVDDNTRYYLHAIQCEPATHRVVSTNGHVLLIATDAEPIADEDFPVIAGAEFSEMPAQSSVRRDLTTPFPGEAKGAKRYHPDECEKVFHGSAQPYNHGDGDDGPYRIGDDVYCGRCHAQIGGVGSAS